MIYLASPYSSPDPLIMKTRFLLAEQCTAELLKRKIWVYSPIVHCHELAHKYDLPKDHEYWLAYNFAMLRRCESLAILTIPGWRESKGVAEEIKFAELAGIGIDYITAKGQFIPCA